MSVARTHRSGLWLIGTFAAGVTWLALPGLAFADHLGGSVGISRSRAVWVPSVYGTKPRTVVIPAQYVVQERKIWREPVYETRERLVEIPAEVVTERVARYDAWGRLVGYDTVARVVRPARTVWREERVLLEPGHVETVRERVCLRPVTTKVVFEKVVVAPGHRSERRPAVIHKGRAFERQVFDHRLHRGPRSARGMEISFKSGR